MACAASPISSALPRDQGQALIVAIRPSGACMNCAANPGMSGTASGNHFSKKRAASSSPTSSANDGEPSKGKNSVQVKLPSLFGSAISMKLPRGQMCSALRCIAKPPSLGGMVSSL